MKRINRNPSIARVSVLVGENVANSVTEYLTRAETLIYARNKQGANVDITQPRRYRDGDIIVFSATIRFKDGQVLDVRDNFSADSSGNWKRKFAYYFGEPTDSDDVVRQIFLIDNHNLWGGEEHLHSEDGERLTDGHPDLNGFCPANVDISDVLRFVDLYFEGKPFPWDAQ